MTFRHVRRGGPYCRVADPDWDDPLDSSYAAARGGRWNPPGSFPVLYLNRDAETARANTRRRFDGHPFGIDDLAPGRRPVLVRVEVPDRDHVDVVTDAGCEAAGLSAAYPRDGAGVVAHETCRPIGLRAWDDGEPGIACRSAAAGAWPPGEELAWFRRGEPLLAGRVEPFADWYWR